MASRLLAACAIVAAIVSSGGGQPQVLAEDEQFSVRITSPLGRTGLPGTIRIVAQVYHRSDVPPAQVRFYVDDQLLRSLDQGPPYAVEWVDDNPFELREIAVEAVDVQGNAARDEIVLEPFEVIEAADIAAVILDTSVQDRNGRFIKNLDVSIF